MRSLISLAAALAALCALPAQAEDLSIGQPGVPSVTIGSMTTFTLRVTNSGAALVYGETVAVEDGLPVSFTQVSVSASGWNCSVQQTTTMCTFPGAQVGANTSLPPISITAQANVVGNIENCGRLTVDGPSREVVVVNSQACTTLVVTGSGK